MTFKKVNLKILIRRTFLKRVIHPNRSSPLKKPWAPRGFKWVFRTVNLQKLNQAIARYHSKRMTVKENQEATVFQLQLVKCLLPVLNKNLLPTKNKSMLIY